MQTSERQEARVEPFVSMLRESQQQYTKAVLWKIPHNSGQDGFSLKIGRYKRQLGLHLIASDVPSVENPKSELTLTEDEFSSLIEFLRNGYEPFKYGLKSFIGENGKFTEKEFSFLKNIFANPDRTNLINAFVEHKIISSDVLFTINNIGRSKL